MNVSFLRNWITICPNTNTNLCLSISLPTGESRRKIHSLGLGEPSDQIVARKQGLRRSALVFEYRSLYCKRSASTTEDARLASSFGCNRRLNIVAFALPDALSIKFHTTTRSISKQGRLMETIIKLLKPLVKRTK